MDKETRKAIEDAGFQVASARDFLGLTEEENQIVELRVAMARRIRELRESDQLTQRSGFDLTPRE